MFFRVVNKRKTFDPIDFESIDKVEYWIAEEVDSPPLVTLSAEEIQDDIIYDDITLPIPKDSIIEDGGMFLILYVSFFKIYVTIFNNMACYMFYIDLYEEQGNEVQLQAKDGIGRSDIGVGGSDLKSFSQEDVDPEPDSSDDDDDDANAYQETHAWLNQDPPTLQKS